MSSAKTPGLFIRISHLIIIQVLFIFAAVTLALFLPGDDQSLAQHHVRQGQQVQALLPALDNLIDGDSAAPIVTPFAVADAERILSEAGSIDALDIIFHDTRSGTDTLIHLADRGGTNMHLRDFGSYSYQEISRLIKASEHPYLNLISADGRYCGYFMLPAKSEREFIIIATTGNTVPQAAEGNQAKLLLLLFLFSTLISLLIINLMFRGFKRPLGRLLEALEKTAAGQEHYLASEEGDRDIVRLTQAFNQMAESLTEKQRKLTLANRDLMKANKSLVESESILTALVDYSPDAIIVTDLDDQVIIYNQQTARDFGYNQSDMLGKKIGNLFSSTLLQSALELPPGSASDPQEIICRRRDGSRFPAVLVHAALGPEGCKPIAILYFVKDISVSDNYQSMILKLDRTASRGKMARDIAHEINNYLAVLQGNLELLPMFLAKNDPAKCEQKINVMKETVAKITNFSEGLTKFSEENSEFRKEDLNQLIENLVAFVKPQNKFDDILIGTNLSESLPLVEIESGQIQLLLVNLLYNAAESLAAFEGTRWIIITTQVDDSGKSVHIKVADSGDGVAPENIERLFVERFSTRRSNGLGLITCKNVVDNHHGRISYHSSDESHAIFAIEIPIQRAESATGNESSFRPEVSATVK